MARGRNPKPSSVKAAEGNRSERRSRAKIKVDPVMKGRPVAPKRLSAEARRIWAEIMSSMPDGLVARVDIGILERYCVAYERWAEINYEIDRRGLRGHPDGCARTQAQGRARWSRSGCATRCSAPLGQMAKEMHVTGGELGLSPVARARLATLPQSTGDDPMSMLLGGDGRARGAVGGGVEDASNDGLRHQHRDPQAAATADRQAQTSAAGVGEVARGLSPSSTCRNRIGSCRRAASSPSPTTSSCRPASSSTNRSASARSR